jgi:hypothetical protein
MSHEVGHIPQIDKAGSNAAHLAGSFWEYLKNWNYLKDSHDHAYALKEKEADYGMDVFVEFSDFIDMNYDKNYKKKGYKEGSMLEKLFNNKNNSQKTIIKRLNQWWKNFQKSK